MVFLQDLDVLLAMVAALRSELDEVWRAWFSTCDNFSYEL